MQKPLNLQLGAALSAHHAVAEMWRLLRDHRWQLLLRLLPALLPSALALAALLEVAAQYVRLHAIPAYFFHTLHYPKPIIRQALIPEPSLILIGALVLLVLLLAGIWRRAYTNALIHRSHTLQSEGSNALTEPLLTSIKANARSAIRAALHPSRHTWKQRPFFLRGIRVRIFLLLAATPLLLAALLVVVLYFSSLYAAVYSYATNGLDATTPTSFPLPTAVPAVFFLLHTLAFLPLALAQSLTRWAIRLMAPSETIL